ncbi:conserved protein of unknown function [Nitrospira japonica]|uniref:Ribbon-helix-helix protein CopG domain-containing protein n=1 Tax=Nitrospira japonica TaxID=1325564 RepID=A0A1W1I323_9BACT|nr:conserved protein of unknown function [Nitrospira japonica]
MRMARLNIQLPKPLKTKLDAQRQRGTTASGLIRHLLEEHFNTDRRRTGRNAPRGF